MSAATICVATLVSSTTTARTSPPDESARGKEWVAMGSAYGSALAEESGVTVAWLGSILSAFKFTVDGAGLVAGQWVLAGGGTQEVGVAGVTATGVLEYSGGGALGGDESVLVATGSVRTTGVVQPMGLAIDNTNGVGPLAIDVDVWCDEMWGSWELTVEDAFEDAGFSAAQTTFDGTFVGHVRYEGFSDEAVAELNEHGFSMETLNRWSGDYSLVERVEFEVATIQAHLAAVAWAAERLEATYPDWTGPDAYAVVDQIHALLNVFRNLSGCARSALGADDVERWTDSLHASLRRLIFKLVNLELYPGRPPRVQSFAAAPATLTDPEVAPDPKQATLAYLQLVDFAMRSAVIGAGALDPSAAVAAEEALIDAGSRLLTDLAAVGGTDDDRRRVLVAGALMGWEFDDGGAPVAAAAALAELGLGS